MVAIRYRVYNRPLHIQYTEQPLPAESSEYGWEVAGFTITPTAQMTLRQAETAAKS